MKIGFSIPQLGPQAHQGSQAARVARELEIAGADSLWVGDRVFAPTNPKVGYGGGNVIPDAFNSVLDPFVVLSAAAAVTDRVRLGTNVLIAPVYRAALLARSLTSIDVISDGRLIAGLGIGWAPEEYEAVGVPFAQRGARLDETIAALRAIWTTDPAGYRGRFETVPEHRSELKPVQRPHPPICLGARSEAGLRRVGRSADGWLPVLRAPGPDDQGDTMRTMRSVVDRAAADAGRDPAAISTIVRVNLARGADPGQLVSTIERCADETGFDDFFIDLLYAVDTVDEVAATAQQLLDRLRG